MKTCLLVVLIASCATAPRGASTSEVTLRLSAPQAVVRIGDSVTIDAILRNTGRRPVTVLADMSWPDCYSCMVGVMDTSGASPSVAGPRARTFDVTIESLVEVYGVRLAPGDSVVKRAQLNATPDRFGYRFDSAGMYLIYMNLGMPHPSKSGQMLTLYAELWLTFVRQ